MTGDDRNAGVEPTRATISGLGWASRLDLALDRLIHGSQVASPDKLPELVSDAAGHFGAEDPLIYLADVQQRVLVPFVSPVGRDHDTYADPLGIDSTVAGRAFQHTHQLSQPANPDQGGERTRVWLPLLAGAERLGVLGVTLPTQDLDDSDGMRGLERFASVVASLVMTKTLYGDSIVRTRRTNPMTLAAELQWSLLPPLTFISPSITVAGGLEPAYEVAGDSLDYAVDAGAARFAVFDGMGHGLVSAQLISLVIAAYRNARRLGQSLTETAGHIESAVNEVLSDDSFATGLLCELDTASGRLTWISAGHLEPLLLRGGRFVRTLHLEPILPLGLNEALGHSLKADVGSEQLEPGDLVLIYTDGVTEARSPGGEFFGQERLVDMVLRNLAAGLATPETMRRVVHALLEHQAGHLDDDATLLIIEWHGPQ
jgi:Stage II sporulation protein E (SpoIIE)